MQKDQSLDILDRIKPVEAPAFLLTRIRERINAIGSTVAPVQWKWAFAAGTLVLLLLNVGIIVKSGNAKKTPGLEQVLTAMHLSTTNDLYR